MNYYEHHLGDYAKDTAHLSMLEHGAYRLLLDRYYSTEAGIPADQAHRVTRARTREEKQAVDTVLNEFFRIVDGIWINQRAEEEIEATCDALPRLSRQIGFYSYGELSPLTGGKCGTGCLVQRADQFGVVDRMDEHRRAQLHRHQ